MTTMVGLYVEYKAKTQELDQALNRMGHEIDQVKAKQNQLQSGFSTMHSNMSSGLNSILGYWKQIVAAIAVYELVSKFNDVAESIDRISKSAGTLGTSVENLQRLKYIGDLAGVSMDQLEMSMRKMSLSLGQAMRGSEGTNKALQALGLSMNNLRGKDVSEQYTLITEALGKVRDKNLQAALAMEFFGKNYSSALKMIRQGVDETGREFDKLGLALTNSQAEAVESFNDSKTRLAAIWEGFSTKVVAYIAPTFEKILTFINDTIIKMGGIDTAAQKFSKAIVSGVQAAISAVNSLLNGLESVQKVLLFLENRSLLQKREEIGPGPGAGRYNIRPDQFSNPGDFVRNLQNSGDSYLPSIDIAMQTGKIDKQLTENYKALNDIEKSASSRKDFLKPLQGLIQTEADKIGQSKNPVLDAAVDGAKSALNRFTDNLQESNDKISSMLKSMDQGAVNDRLKSIFSRVNGPQGLNTLFGQTNEEFDKLAADIINGVREGQNPNGANVQSSLATLDFWAKQSGATGQLGVVEELKKYLQGLGAKEQKVEVNIHVEPNENFWIKWSTDENVKNAINKQVNDIAVKTARQMRGS